MRKVLIILVAVMFTFLANAQRTNPTVVLLESFTFDNDTTLTYGYSDDYRGLIQIECTSLNATDATIGFKHKLAGFTNYEYISNDTTSYSDGCSKYIMDGASYHKAYFYNYTPGDTLQIILLKNSNTSGTVDRLAIRRYYND